MLVLPDIYVLKTESIQKKTFLEDNLNKKLDEKKINNENFDKKFLIKIDDLDLPVRVLNFLKTENINYVGELIQYTEKDILSFPNSGRKSLQDIKYELSQINLTLGIKLDKERDLYKNIEEVAEYKIKHKLKEEQLILIIANYQRGVYDSKADFLQAIAQTNEATFIDEMPEDNHYLVNEGINDSEYEDSEQPSSDSEDE
jgi:hypothetical protein